MKIVLADPSLFKESISIISELVSEVRFKINATALEMVAMDNANISMIIFKMFSSAFVEYKVDGDTELSVNLLNLKQILQRAQKTDVLTIELAEENRLKIILKGRITRTFFLPLIDINEEEQKIPELEMKAKIKTDSIVIKDAIDDCDVVSDSVSFIAEKDNFSIESKGDSSKVRIDIPKDDITTIEASEFVKSKYSIEYLKKMLKASKLNETIEIQFSQEYPLRINFTKEDILQLVFILAPRVDND